MTCKMYPMLGDIPKFFVEGINGDFPNCIAERSRKAATFAENHSAGPLARG